MTQYEPRHRHTFEEPWSTPNLSVNNHPYPPPTGNYGPPSTVTLAPGGLGRRDLSRTPSPTPSEAKELKTGAFDWETLGKWRFWIRKEWIWYYVALVIICTLTALMTLYHKQIVEWLTPVTRWMHDLSYGWIIPIGVLFVISFPPLFGHEIVAVLCGVVWGLWIGFGIVAAGTFIGEVGNFYAFKYCCRARGEKMERTKIPYACLAKVVRDGGFKIALIARLSAIPGHFTTAVFSTCGMGIIVFSIAAILSLPKQFITVYLGVILEQSASGTTDTKSRIISDVVLAVTFLITIAAMWYIYRQMNKVKPQVIYERRKARQAKLANAYSPGPSTSEVNIPLTSPRPQYPFTSQIGSTIVYAPSPSNSDVYEYKPSNNYGYQKREESDDTSSSGHSDSSVAHPRTDEVAWDRGRYTRTPPGIGVSYPRAQYPDSQLQHRQSPTRGNSNTHYPESPSQLPYTHSPSHLPYTHSPMTESAYTSSTPRTATFAGTQPQSPRQSPAAAYSEPAYTSATPRMATFAGRAPLPNPYAPEEEPLTPRARHEAELSYNTHKSTGSESDGEIRRTYSPPPPSYATHAR
ncbi:hypothetical protein BDZ89DRAFT_1156808 [Hymenopellis radicata]|nr:hypothetical protein BDZ89DRAFT_1156808 [Hymenopellis radicata]